MSSGLGGFLFGNIDEEGKLDNEDFDEELRTNLTTFSERIQDRKLLLEGGFLAEDLIKEFSNDQQPQTGQNKIVMPLPDAENFEDINELAEPIGIEPAESSKEAEPFGLIEPIAAIVANNNVEENDFNGANEPQFDTRQILKFTRLSAKPALLNATGRSYSRYAALRKLRLKRKQLHGKGTSFASAENQLEVFLNRTGASIGTPSTASARLRLSLVNLSGTAANSATASLSKSKKPWHQSNRFHELESALNKTRTKLSRNIQEEDEESTYKKIDKTSVKLPDNSHFHPISLLEWENEIIWDCEEAKLMKRPNQAGGGMYVNVNLAGPINPGPSGPTAPQGNSQTSTSNPVAGASLSSILSSLSLSNGALGGDSASSSATATALLALIRNQQMRSASISSGSLSTVRPSISGAASASSLSRSNSSSIPQTAAASIKLKFPKAPAARILNRELDSGDWSNSIIWDVQEIDPSQLKTHLILPLDDPELIFTPLPVENLSKKIGRAEKLIAKRLKKLQSANSALNSFAKPIMDKFNLSNDKYYESSGGNEHDSSSHHLNNKTTTSQKSAQDQSGPGGKTTISSSSRSSVSAAFLGLHHSVPALQHSVPALKLSPPAFQSCRTKRELRLWHRPRLSIPPGFTISTWLKVKPASKKPTNSVASSVTEISGILKLSISTNPAGGIIRSAKKLTLKDSCRFVVLEYFEEFPPLLMNPGMGAYIVLYYRKKSPQDTFVPKSTFALVQVLDFTDPSPFMMFGDVPAGCSRYALCNGLFRAPLFLHKATNSDFIVSRHTHQQSATDDSNAASSTSTQPDAEFYLRPLEAAPVLLVGQEFPLVEVPGPHSRRHNLFCRQRLQVAAYRLFNKDPLLPDSGHSRRRLKIGRLLTAFPQFSEGSIRKWLKEYAESTRAGKDSGVWLLKEDAPQLDEDELRSLVTPEAICQYESMMAEQQRLTDAEIILHDPFNTNTAAPVSEVTDENEEGRPGKAKSKELEELTSAAPWNTTANFLGAVQGRCTLKLRGLGDPSGRGEAFSFVKAPGEKGTSSAVANSIGSEYRQDISRIWEAHINSLSTGTSSSVPASTSTTNHQQQHAVNQPQYNTSSIPEQAKLVISRRFGVDQWITEEITDPLIIKAYLRVRQQQASSTVDKSRRGFVAPDSLPTLSASDAAPLSTATTKTVKKQQKRPPSSQKSTTSTSISTNSNAQSIESRNIQIKCGACGNVGHMRTNRICPMFTESPDPAASTTTNTLNVPTSTTVLPKLKLKLSSNSTSSNVSSNSAASISSNESIYPSPVLLPVSHRPKGPPIEPIQTIRKRPRKLTPKQLHAQFLASQSIQVRSKLAALSTILISIVDSLILLPSTPAFHKPVSRKLYPLYYKLISNPIDLSTIRTKAVALTYKSSSEFLDDFKLLRDNCETFNGKEAPLSEVARDMLTRVQNSINENEQVHEADNFLKENIKLETSDDSENVQIENCEVSILTDGESEDVKAKQEEDETVENGNGD